MTPSVLTVQKLPRTARSSGGEVYTNTGCFKDPALDKVRYRVVAEKSQVAGAAAGDDSGGHGYGEPAHGEGGETIKVGG